jgi:NAD(P)-dependent dehydrogenase (short-subunit alcohol dehydrogenase family)
VVVVTGASAGVGRATARAFARRGSHIGLLARGREGLEGARRDVEALGGKALIVPTDVADAAQVELAAATVEEHFGPIDIWVNKGYGNDSCNLGPYDRVSTRLSASPSNWRSGCWSKLRIRM